MSDPIHPHLDGETPARPLTPEEHERAGGCFAVQVRVDGIGHRWDRDELCSAETMQN
ncbi:MAG TPA: hypothetical protein VM759_03670 [Longimicrobium sp.]|nr:hypothetical protein [Longimicrobium sp.]